MVTMWGGFVKWDGNEEYYLFMLGVGFSNYTL